MPWQVPRPWRAGGKSIVVLIATWALLSGARSREAVAAEQATAPMLTLQQAISAALTANPALQGFAFRIRAQDARVRQAGLRPAPEVSVDLENVLGSGETRGFDAAEATFALSQVIELGGKRDARIAAAAAGRSALDIEFQARQLDVLADVTRRFIAVAEGQEQVRLARDAAELARATLAASEIRVSAAKAPHAELDRARIVVERARLDERAARIDLDIARRQLAATWAASDAAIDGQPIGEVRADLLALPPVGDFSELRGRLEANPDFLRFASEARLRDAESRLAATARRADIALGVGIRRLEATDDQALVASFSMPLFAGRRADNLVAEARANRDLVDAERRIAEMRAQATLYELHQQLARSVSEAGALRQEILPRTEEALRETEFAYERGRYGYIELIDAQRAYLDVRANLVRAASNAHLFRTEIERLTGESLTRPPVPEPEN